MTRLLLLALLLPLAGCDALKTRDADRTAAEARADDAYCTGSGASFPSIPYTSCRYRLAEKRQSDSYQELALGTSMAAPEWQHDRAQPVAGNYRALDPERFECNARGAGETRVVLCGVR